MPTISAPIDTTTALHIFNFIRMAKQPPLARYATLLTLHETGLPMTTHQIAKRMRCDGPQSGTIDSCLRAGLIRTAQGSTPSNHYELTPEGTKEVERLLTEPLEALA